MTDDEVRDRFAAAEEIGYRFAVRHQPAVELEEPDWIVVIYTPDGRVLFPGAVDNEEAGARRRAAQQVKVDMIGRMAVHA